MQKTLVLILLVFTLGLQGTSSLAHANEHSQNSGVNDFDQFEAEKITKKNQIFLEKNFREDKKNPMYLILKDLKFGQNQIDKNFFKAFINPNNCRYNFQYFVGCLEAIKALISENEPNSENEFKIITTSSVNKYLISKIGNLKSKMPSIKFTVL